MKTIGIQIVTAVILLYSCNSNEKSSLNRVKVGKDSTEELNLSDIAESTQAIVLETTDSCLLSGIMKIEESDESVFIYDYIGPKIAQFDLEGNFINTIGSVGRGPGEYQYINSFTINRENKVVYVATRKRILAYNYSGDHIKTGENKPNTLIEDMSWCDNRLWLVANGVGRETKKGGFINKKVLYGLDNSLEFTDSASIGDVHFKSLSLASHPMPFLVSCLTDNIFVYSPEILYEEFIRDTLFQLVDHDLRPYLKFDFEVEKSLKDPRRSILIKNIYKSQRFTFLEYDYKKTPNFFVYDQKEEKTWNTKGGLIDDIYHSGSIILRPLDEEKGLFYFIKDAYNLNGIIDGIDEEDNPVLFIVTVRN